MSFFKNIRIRNSRILFSLTTIIISFVSATANADQPRDRISGDSCPFLDPIYDIPRLWGFMAAFDFDENLARPAIIDIGILDDGNVSNDGTQCDVTYQPSQLLPANFNCDSPVDGEYDGILPGRERHGNNMKNLIAATVNDRVGDDVRLRAGIAGQVAIPNLYRFDEVHNYVFELYSTIDKAVADDSTVINISGGFPCRWKSPIGSTTFDICTIEGRAAAVASICFTPQSDPYLLPAGLLCGLGIASAAEGDIRDLISNSVTSATLAGVPVVSSAGNVVSGLEGQLSGAVIGNADITDWKILPATIPQVIAVGGVTSGTPYLNTDFHGPQVDIWAPRNDTSPAAAYISGLISLAQAINPDLHPATTTDIPLTLPGRIRDLLVDTAYTSSDLSAMGHDDPTGLRRNLVNPYAFIQAVSENLVPDYESLGYTNRFDSWVGSFDTDHSNGCDDAFAISDAPDTEADAESIAVTQGMDETINGTILYMPGRPDDIIDEDWYRLDYSTLSALGIYSTELELRYLTGYGDLMLESPGIPLSMFSNSQSGSETIVKYTTKPMLRGASLVFKVSGTSAQEDNLYRLTIKQGLPVRINPDRYDSASLNDTQITATEITQTDTDIVVENFNASQAPTTKSIHIPDLNTHRLDDFDHLFLRNFPFPEGDLLNDVRYTISTDNNDIILAARTPAGLALRSGQSQLTFNRFARDDLRIEARNRYSGVYSNYSLKIETELDPPPAHPDLSEAAIRQFQELVNTFTQAPGEPAIAEIGCLVCNTLQARGEIQISNTKHPLARDTRFNADVKAIRFIQASTSGEIKLEFKKMSRNNGFKADLYDTSLRRIASGKQTRSGLTLNTRVRAGAYVLVLSSKDQISDQNYLYEMKLER